MTDWRDIIERAIWTFVQAFLGTLTAMPIAELITNVDVPGGQAALLSAVGAGVAALLSFVKTLAQERLSVPETRAHLP